MLRPFFYSYFSLVICCVFFFISQPCISSRAIAKMTSNAPLTVSSIERYNDKWQNIEVLLDLGRDDTNSINGVSQIKSYLHRFGYLPLSSQNVTDIFDARFESALKQYQEQLGLRVTGKLDYDTLSQIVAPRCGVRDSVYNHFLHGTKHYVYFPGKPRWVRQIPMTLTYSFSPDYMIYYLSVTNIKDAFKRAFSKWASVIPVSFIETDDYDFADIKIGFYKGDHGDGEPFDGVLGVLAHAFSPETGRFHLDADERWAVDFELEKSTVAIDLESVATHEIGHLLGLGHSNVKEAVMYPSLKPREKKLELKVDDIEGVQSLYGTNPNYRVDPLLESDISANGCVDLGLGSALRVILSLISILSLFMYS